MISKRHGRARREEGFALFLSILLLLVLSVLGIALLFTASTENSLSGNETKVSKVFYAACSGVDYATAKLAVDKNYVGGQMPVGVSSHYPGLTGDIQVTIEGDGVVVFSGWLGSGSSTEFFNAAIFAVTTSDGSLSLFENAATGQQFYMGYGQYETYYLGS